MGEKTAIRGILDEGTILLLRQGMAGVVLDDAVCTERQGQEGLAVDGVSVSVASARDGTRLAGHRGRRFRRRTTWWKGK